ncbi:hypothetical protein [Rhizobium sp. PDO1-076]|nr:hypothetical protein [Rhizobium sp. PDO1-076]
MFAWFPEKRQNHQPRQSDDPLDDGQIPHIFWAILADFSNFYRLIKF